MPSLPADLAATVERALHEDLGNGDLLAGLLPPEAVTATVICREDGVLCGTAWFEQVYRQLDADVQCQWRATEGTLLHGGQEVCRLHGAATAVLAGERTALNFMQLLSGTATLTRRYVEAVAGTAVLVLDTRKTIPGLRAAQKYAVVCAGGHNHRMGLYDKILLKENHLLVLGGVTAALQRVIARYGVDIATEVEDLAQLQQALAAGVRHVVLDNFDVEALRAAVQCNAGRACLEASGGITPERAARIAETGVDCISAGALTHSVCSVDFSMRLLAEQHG